MLVLVVVMLLVLLSLSIFVCLCSVVFLVVVFPWGPAWHVARGQRSQHAETLLSAFLIKYLHWRW